MALRRITIDDSVGDRAEGIRYVTELRNWRKPPGQLITEQQYLEEALTRAVADYVRQWHEANADEVGRAYRDGNAAKRAAVDSELGRTPL